MFRLIDRMRSRYSIILLFAMLNLAAFSILRFVLLILSWGKIDHTLANIAYIFWAGFIYDAVFNIYFSIFFALLLLFIPNRLYTGSIFKVLTYCFFFAFIYGLYFVLLAEWLFWDEFSVRFNFISVDYLIYRHEVVQNIWESYPVGWLLTGIGVFSMATFWGLKSRMSKILSIKEGFSKRCVIFTGILTASFLSYVFVGQSLRDFSSNNFATELASNGPYQFVAAFKNNKLDYESLYRQADDDQLSPVLKKMVGKDPDAGDVYDISREIESKAEEKRLNVILVSVESLSAKYLTRFGNKEDITPFMDQWFKQGLLFTNFYATGTRTARGLEAITLSIPPTPGRSIVKRPDNANYHSLGEVFKDRGYDVAFLYGGIGFFDNMNTFFSGNGYRIVDQTDFTDNEITFQNAWGVSDEDLYRKTIQQANQSFADGKPFFFHVMTTSNHRPYSYPDGKVAIPSGTNRSGAVEYTDYALRQLMTLAREQPWFEQTIFLIVADHCGNSAGKVGLPVDKYHIPLFIYAPDTIPPKEIDKVASQIDIAPTLLSLLNFNYKSYFFGQDILSDDFIERALIGNYQKLALYEDNRLVILSPGQKIEIINNPLCNDCIFEEKKALTRQDVEAMSYYQGSNYILEHRLNRLGKTDMHS